MLTQEIKEYVKKTNAKYTRIQKEQKEDKSIIIGVLDIFEILYDIEQIIKIEEES